MLTRDIVLTALKNCYDPEIPINIVDLGLIYDIRLDDGNVEIDMTLTARGCPMHGPMADDVKEKVEALEGVKNVKVNVVWEPAWTPERMSSEARKMMGFDIEQSS